MRRYAIRISSFSSRNCDLEDQRLAIKIIPARVRIRELTVIQKSVLCDEVVVAQAENKILIVRVLWVGRDYGDRFPLLILSAS